MHSLRSRLLEAEEDDFEVWKLVTILMLSQALEFGGRLPRDDILPLWNQFTSVNLAWRNNWNSGWCVYVLLELWMVCVCALGTVDGVCLCSWNCGWCVYSWNCGWCVYVLLELWMVCVCAFGTVDGVCLCSWNCGWCVFVLLELWMVCVCAFATMDGVCMCPLVLKGFLQRNADSFFFSFFFSPM